MKAVLDFVCYEKGYRILWYKYKGYSYCVQDMGCSGFSLVSQHKQAQNRIDSLIEMEERAKENDEGDAFADFEYFWNYVEGNGDEF